MQSPEGKPILEVDFAAVPERDETFLWPPRQESNLHLALRRRPFYPLNYGGPSAILRAARPLPHGLLDVRRAEAVLGVVLPAHRDLHEHVFVAGLLATLVDTTPLRRGY
jgi:hypothetical protein